MVKHRNERLRQAIRGHGLSMRDLAVAVRVDFKTVQRWCYEGRVPRRKSQARVARVLELEPEWLWPTGTSPAWAPDLVRMYARFDQVPPSMWAHLARTAERGIDIACDDPLVLGRDAIGVIMGGASAGLAVRVCGSNAVQALSLAGADVRRPGRPLTCAVFRFDATIIVWLQHGDDSAGHRRPVLHLARADGALFDTYVDLFNQVWTSGLVAVGVNEDWLQAPASASIAGLGPR